MAVADLGDLLGTALRKPDDASLPPANQGQNSSLASRMAKYGMNLSEAAPRTASPSSSFSDRLAKYGLSLGVRVPAPTEASPAIGATNERSDVQSFLASERQEGGPTGSILTPANQLPGVPGWAKKYLPQTESGAKDISQMNIGDVAGETVGASWQAFNYVLDSLWKMGPNEVLGALSGLAKGAREGGAIDGTADEKRAASYKTAFKEAGKGLAASLPGPLRRMVSGAVESRGGAPIEEKMYWPTAPLKEAFQGTPMGKALEFQPVDWVVQTTEPYRRSHLEQLKNSGDAYSRAIALANETYKTEEHPWVDALGSAARGLTVADILDLGLGEKTARALTPIRAGHLTTKRTPVSVPDIEAAATVAAMNKAAGNLPKGGAGEVVGASLARDATKAAERAVPKGAEFVSAEGVPHRVTEVFEPEFSGKPLRMYNVERQGPNGIERLVMDEADMQKAFGSARARVSAVESIDGMPTQDAAELETFLNQQSIASEAGQVPVSGPARSYRVASNEQRLDRTMQQLREDAAGRRVEPELQVPVESVPEVSGDPIRRHYDALGETMYKARQEIADTGTVSPATIREMSSNRGRFMSALTDENLPIPTSSEEIAFRRTVVQNEIRALGSKQPQVPSEVFRWGKGTPDYAGSARGPKTLQKFQGEAQPVGKVKFRAGEPVRVYEYRGRLIRAMDDGRGGVTYHNFNPYKVGENFTWDATEVGQAAKSRFEAVGNGSRAPGTGEPLITQPRALRTAEQDVQSRLRRQLERLDAAEAEFKANAPPPVDPATGTPPSSGEAPVFTEGQAHSDVQTNAAQTQAPSISHPELVTLRDTYNDVAARAQAEMDANGGKLSFQTLRELTAARTKLRGALFRGADDVVTDVAEKLERSEMLKTELQRLEDKAKIGPLSQLTVEEEYMRRVFQKQLDRLQSATAEAFPTTAKTTESQGVIGEPSALPPLRDNFSKPLDAYAPVLYRESSIDDAGRYIPGYTTTDTMYDEPFFSNNRDLAAGQGKNKGIMLEFDAGPLMGNVSTSKPTWEVSWSRGDGEFVGRLNDQKTYQKALRSITVSPDAIVGQADKTVLKTISQSERAHLKTVLDNLEQQGWKKSSSPGGGVTYTRPGITSAPEGVVSPKPEPPSGAPRVLYREGAPNEYTEFTADGKMSGGRGTGHFGSGQYSYSSPGENRVAVRGPENPLVFEHPTLAHQFHQWSMNVLRAAEGAKLYGESAIRSLDDAAEYLATLSRGTQYEVTAQEILDAIATWQKHRTVHPTNILLGGKGKDGVVAIGKAAREIGDNGEYGNVTWPQLDAEGLPVGLEQKSGKYWEGPSRAAEGETVSLGIGEAPTGAEPASAPVLGAETATPTDVAAAERPWTFDEAKRLASERGINLEREFLRAEQYPEGTPLPSSDAGPSLRTVAGAGPSSLRSGEFTHRVGERAPVVTDPSGQRAFNFTEKQPPPKFDLNKMLNEMKGPQGEAARYEAAERGLRVWPPSNRELHKYVADHLAQGRDPHKVLHDLAEEIGITSLKDYKKWPESQREALAEHVMSRASRSVEFDQIPGRPEGEPFPFPEGATRKVVGPEPPQTKMGEWPSSYESGSPTKIIGERSELTRKGIEVRLPFGDWVEPFPEAQRMVGSKLKGMWNKFEQLPGVNSLARAFSTTAAPMGVNQQEWPKAVDILADARSAAEYRTNAIANEVYKVVSSLDRPLSAKEAELILHAIEAGVELTPQGARVFLDNLSAKGVHNLDGLAETLSSERLFELQSVADIVKTAEYEIGSRELELGMLRGLRDERYVTHYIQPNTKADPKVLDKYWQTDAGKVAAGLNPNTKYQLRKGPDTMAQILEINAKEKAAGNLEPFIVNEDALHVINNLEIRLNDHANALKNRLFLEKATQEMPHIISKTPIEGAPTVQLWKKASREFPEGIYVDTRADSELSRLLNMENVGGALGRKLKWFEHNVTQPYFKRWATVYRFPSFQERAWADNTFKNWLAGAHPEAARVSRGAIGGLKGTMNGPFNISDYTWRNGRWEFTPGSVSKVESLDYEQLHQLADAMGVLRGGAYGAPEMGGSRITRKLEDTPLRKAMHQLSPVAIGEDIENMQRMTHFVTRLAEWKDANAAMRTTKRAMFDYANISPFERDIIRPLVPFYTWARKSTPYILSQAAENPAKIAALGMMRDKLERILNEGRAQDHSRDREFGLNWTVGGRSLSFMPGVSLNDPLQFAPGKFAQTADTMAHPLIRGALLRGLLNYNPSKQDAYAGFGGNQMAPAPFGFGRIAEKVGLGENIGGQTYMNARTASAIRALQPGYLGAANPPLGKPGREIPPTLTPLVRDVTPDPRSELLKWYNENYRDPYMAHRQIYERLGVKTPYASSVPQFLQPPRPPSLPPLRTKKPRA